MGMVPSLECQDMLQESQEYSRLAERKMLEENCRSWG